MDKQRSTLLIRRVLDAALTALLLCLMAYPVTGEAIHEWIGIAMTAALILHHVLNRRWYGALRQGRYTLLRGVNTAVTSLLTVSIVLTAVSGMSISTRAVPFLYGLIRPGLARRLHLAFSYWSFLLMGLHLGLHLPAMTASIRPGKAVGAALTGGFTLLAGWGLWLFCRDGIPRYLFFWAMFARFDYAKPGALVFLENLAELFFFVFLGANFVRLSRLFSRRGQKAPEEPRDRPRASAPKPTETTRRPK